MATQIQLDMDVILRLYDNQNFHSSLIFTYSPEHSGKKISQDLDDLVYLLHLKLYYVKYASTRAFPDPCFSI